MAENSKIQWTDHTVNFWTGCKKVSDGCKYCYMYRDKERYGKDPTEVVKVNAKTINKVLKEAKPGDKIFTCSWSDFFIKEADEWRKEAWDIIRDNPQFEWQILTKRPERIKECLPDDWGDGWKQVWLGVSVENSKSLKRVSVLTDLNNGAANFKTFISFEPLIGDVFDAPLDVDDSLSLSMIDWVIVGGESGNDNGAYLYRPCQIEWMNAIIKPFQDNGTPVFVKQLGTHLSKQLGLSDRHGGDINEFPISLQIREFPQGIR